MQEHICNITYLKLSMYRQFKSKTSSTAVLPSYHRRAANLKV